ncbi:MAG TPA: chromosome segregation protein SMC, partial [Bacilli bacterium]
EVEARNIEAQLALYLQDIDAQGDEQEEYKLKKAAIQEALLVYQEEEVQLQQQIREAEITRKANESAKEELQGQMTDLKVKVAGTFQEKQFLQEQLLRFDADLEVAVQELESNRLMLQQLDQDLQTNELESMKQLESLNHNHIKKLECTERIEFTRAERAEWLKKLELEENETREHRIGLKRVEEKLHQTEVKSNRQDVELDNLLKKLAEDYELSFELAKQRYAIPEDIPETQNIVRELKKQMALLGDVNLGAIEEYARVSERFYFLSKQKEDLIEAKTTLYHVIREMDEEMSKKFSKTFEAIREQFVRVFSKLFNGGRADLILADPERILETGIEIVAQPPGKKLQNLQLLSGGERALTAIALLFAILHIKPVPFCVLDEVEAALDESNVTRFAEYLREFSMETQFIVVTHRKGTMHEADVLYGITMEEGGVSKLVSVRLDEDDALESA